jgi:dihydrofolate reductase
MVEAAKGKDLWVVGGGDLACQFAEAGLLDDVVVSIAPVTLGSGRPLFPRPFDLKLVEHDRNGDFLCARYDVVGARG